MFVPRALDVRDVGRIVLRQTRNGKSANRKCALSSALFRGVEVPLALK